MGSNDTSKNYLDYLGELLTEKDFYPPADNRTLQSLVEDIGEGNNFLEYTEYIFDLLEEEGIFEN